MKKFILCLTVSLVFIASKNNNTHYGFNIKDNNLIWESIYECDSASIISQVKKSGILTNIQVGADFISGEVQDIKADYFGAGFKRALTPIYVANDFFGGKALISFKGSKYKVTLKDIFVVKGTTDALGRAGTKTKLDDYALKKGDYKNLFKKDAAVILDYTFEKLFTFRDDSDSSDW
jgi:hypothetical protein